MSEARNNGSGGNVGGILLNSQNYTSSLPTGGASVSGPTGKMSAGSGGASGAGANGNTTNGTAGSAGSAGGTGKVVIWW